MTTVPKAFQSLCPNCEVNYNIAGPEITYKNAIWLDTEINSQFSCPTEQQILAEVERLKNEEAINDKKSEINALRDAKRINTVEYAINGKIYNFQRDITSQLAFVTAQADDQVTLWITAENVIVELNKTDIINICKLIKNRDTYFYIKAREKKDEIALLETAQEIKDYAANENW